MFDDSQFLAGLASQRQRMVAGAIAGVDALGEKIMAGAIALAPVAEQATKEQTPGELRESAVRSPARLNGTVISSVMGFTAPFAAYVHENLAAHHDVGQAKFLETAVRQGVAIAGPTIGGQLR